MIELTLSDELLDHVTDALAKLRSSSKTVTLRRDAADAMLVDYSRLCQRLADFGEELVGGSAKLKRRSPR